jgi:putative transcriptional regulator
VRLDSDKLKRERQKRGLSVGKLAEMSRISRNTLYGYEKGMARASVNAAYQIEYVLGVPLAQEIDVFQRPLMQDKGFLAVAKLIISKHHCLRSVEHKLSKLNIFVAHTKRAPFDFIARSQEEGVNIVGGVADVKEDNLERRVDEIVSVGRVLRAQPVLIAENEQKAENCDITCIRRDELEKIRDVEDLRCLL